MDIISHAVVGTCEDSCRYSELDLPDLGPFCHVLMSVQQLNAKERFSRLYSVFLSLSNYFLQHSVKKSG